MLPISLTLFRCCNFKANVLLTSHIWFCDIKVVSVINILLLLLYKSIVYFYCRKSLKEKKIELLSDLPMKLQSENEDSVP